jgi:hypothetical protein
MKVKNSPILEGMKKGKSELTLADNHPLVVALSSLFPAQADFLARTDRFYAGVWHRGCGKSFAITVDVCLKALATKPNLKRIAHQHRSFLIAAPQKMQALDVYVNQMSILSFLGGFVESYELAPTTPLPFIRLINGNMIYINGLSEADAFRGKTYDGIYIDETGSLIWEDLAAIMMPTIYRPETNGFLSFFGTPTDSSASLRNICWEWIPQVNGVFKHITFEDNLSPLTKDQVASIKQTMSQVVLDREYYVKLDAKTVTSVYADSLTWIQNNNRIMTGAVNKKLPTFVALDLGFNEDNVAIVYQVDTAGKPIIIHTKRHTRVKAKDIAYELASWLDGYNLQRVYIPHDGVQQRGNAEYTYAQIYSSYFPGKCAVLKKAINKKQEILTAIHFLQDSRVHNDCWKELSSGLLLYNWKVDKFGNVLDDAEEINDHVADCFRYCAVAFNKLYGTAELTEEKKLSLFRQGLLPKEAVHGVTLARLRHEQQSEYW